MTSSVQLYIVSVIDGDGEFADYWYNAADVRYARRAAMRQHTRESGAYCEIYAVQGPFEYDEDQPLASALDFARRDNLSRNRDMRVH